MTWRRASLTLLGFLFAVNVYRAASQAITVDEAYAYYKLLAGPWTDMFTVFDACHHVFYTYLSFISIHLFGISAFSLRLPSVLAGLIYFAGVYRISAWMFASGWRLFLAIAALSLNPYILDFLSAARGYGLALACLVWAAYETARFFAENRESRGLTRAGLWLSGSVAANLTFLFPALALMVASILLLAAARKPSWIAERYLAAAVLPAFVLMVVPFSHAQRSDFYWGEHNFWSGTHSIIADCLYYPLPGFFPADWKHVYPDAAGTLVDALPLVLAALAVPFAAALGGRFREFGSERWMLMLIGATSSITIAGIVAAHWLFRLNYPLDRSGIYLILLFTLLALAAWNWMEARGGAWRWGVWLAVGVIGICVLVFALSFHIDYYRDWDYCRLLKRMIAIVRQESPGGINVRVGGSGVYEPSINFYRDTQRLDWMAPVTRATMDQDADYYLLVFEHRGLIRKLHLRVLLEDPVSKAVLAAPQ